MQCARAIETCLHTLTTNVATHSKACPNVEAFVKTNGAVSARALKGNGLVTLF